MLRSHSKRLTKADFVGVFKQVVFGDCNPFDGTFLVVRTLPYSPGAIGSWTVSDGFAVNLIGDPPVLESTLPNLTSAQ